MLGDEVPIVTVVVVELTAHVEAAIGERVVEQAKARRRLRLPRHVERDVLVQRVRGARAVAHCVDVAHLVALLRAIERAGTLAEAHVHFVAALLDVVIHARVPPAEVVRLGLAIAHHAMPRAFVQDVPCAGAAFERDAHAYARGFDHDMAGCVVHRERRRRKAAQVAALAAFERHVVRAGRDRPRARAVRFAVRQHEHADDVLGEHEQFDAAVRLRAQHDRVGRGVASVRGEREARRMFEIDL
ncbi:hypothetical protein QFZ99_004401 [Paraburkholderia atlantica]